MSKYNKILWLIPMILVSFQLEAQRTRTVELKPIHYQGFRYYYDMKSVRTPYALQMPLQSLDDEEINRRYRSFTRLTAAGNVVALVPFIYILVYVSNNTYYSSGNEFLWVLLGSIGIDLTFDLLAHGQLKKGIDRYNQLIVVPSSSLPGVSVKYRF